MKVLSYLQMHRCWLAVGILCVTMLGLVGCATSGSDPAIVGRAASWYRTTDPHAFFAAERSRGLVYFIGIMKPMEAPGVSVADPHFSTDHTWYVPIHGPGHVLDQEFAEAVRQFASHYNPLVLKYLREHPEKEKRKPLAG